MAGAGAGSDTLNGWQAVTWPLVAASVVAILESVVKGLALAPRFPLTPGVLEYPDVYLGQCHGPVFNLADSAIAVGGVVLSLLSVRGRATKPSPGDGPSCRYQLGR